LVTARDAAVAMAERIAGTEEAFVKMMNDKAEELGLLHTHFDNACGLDSETHYSSSYDMAMIARELIKHEKILEYTGTYEDYLREDTDNSFWLVNTNKLVRYYQGVDGLKTGYTSNAGYCITTTAQKDGMRLITVVMNEPSSSVRNSETTTMLDYGFNLYTLNKLITTDTVVATKEVLLGEQTEVNIVPKTDINVLSLKSDTTSTPEYEYKINTIKAPVKVGDVVGEVKIIENGEVINTVELTVEEDILKVNIFVEMLRNLKDIATGNI
jgi:D-alanyl-D-alanine carboxypeptidase (penicillin-binding protein 5/6)